MAERPFFLLGESNMNLAGIIQVVKDRTRRIDKSDEITTAVRKAVRTVHSAAYFPMDLVEEEVDLNGTHHNFKIPLPPRIRKFVAVAPLASTGQPLNISTINNLYDYISPTDVINSFHTRRNDVYYVAGTALSVKSSVGAAKLYMSFYAQPEVADLNLETWLMEAHEAVFIDAALSDFYNSIGRDKEARAHKQEMLMQLQIIINDYVCMEE